MTVRAGSLDNATVTVDAVPLAGSGAAVIVDPSAGVLPKSKATLVGEPNGSTDPDTVAVEPVTALAFPVLAVGASCNATLPSAPWAVPSSVNHRFPSGPATISSASLPVLVIALLLNSLITPAGVIRAIDKVPGGLAD